MDPISYAVVIIQDQSKPLIESGRPISKEILQAIIDNIDFNGNNTRIFKESSYLNNQVLIMIIRDKKAYLAVVSPDISIRIVLSFLVETSQLLSTYQSPTSRQIKLINHTFNDRRIFYCYDPEADKLRGILKDVDETKLILHDCIEKLLQRSEYLEIIEQKSTKLEQQAEQMRRFSRKLSWKEYWKAKKCMIIGGSAAALTLTTIVAGTIATSV